MQHTDVTLTLSLSLEVRILKNYIGRRSITKILNKKKTLVSMAYTQIFVHKPLRPKVFFNLKS